MFQRGAGKVLPAGRHQFRVQLRQGKESRGLHQGVGVQRLDQRKLRFVVETSKIDFYGKIIKYFFCSKTVFVFFSTTGLLPLFIIESKVLIIFYDSF